MPKRSLLLALRRVRDLLASDARNTEALAELDRAIPLCDELITRSDVTVGSEEALRRDERRRQFLYEASIELAAAVHDYEGTIAKLARLAVPGFADWVAVDVVTEGGAVQRLAVAHVNPQKIVWLQEVERRYPPDPNAPNGVHNILRTGRSEWIARIPEELLVAGARDAEHLAIIHALGLRSYIGVPLVARGRTLGVMTFVTADSGVEYDANDLHFAEELAVCVALALDNARLFKAAEEARARAAAAEEEFRTLAGAVPLIVWSMTPQGDHTYLSPQWNEFTGQSDDEPFTARWPKAVHPDDLERCMALWREARAHDRAWQMEYRLRSADGTYRWHLGRSVPLRDAAGNVLKWYGTATDIEQQKVAIHSRESVLAVVSHDLRSPLSSIVMAARMLLRIAPVDEGMRTAHGYAEKILRATDLMERLIRDLLDLVSIESGHLAITVRAVDANALLREAREAMEPHAQLRGIHLVMEEDPACGLVEGDRQRVLQVFTNLVGNALKFTPRGGTIRLRTRAASGCVEFYVSDTGPGIPPQQLPLIFDRFWRGRADSTQGVGLGLSITKGIVIAHGGTLRAESPPGAGATFCFTLPLARAHAPSMKNTVDPASDTR